MLTRCQTPYVELDKAREMNGKKWSFNCCCCCMLRLRRLCDDDNLIRSIVVIIFPFPLLAKRQSSIGKNCFLNCKHRFSVFSFCIKAGALENERTWSCCAIAGIPIDSSLQLIVPILAVNDPNCDGTLTLNCSSIVFRSSLIDERTRLSYSVFDAHRAHINKQPNKVFVVCFCRCPFSAWIDPKIESA